MVKRLMFFWASIHLLLLILSYSGISIFNNFHFYRSEKLWPFTTFNCFEEHCPLNVLWSTHPGILMDYDYSDFLIYTFPVVIYIIYKLIFSKKKI